MSVKFLGVLLAGCLLVGCSKTPDCGSSDAEKSVIKLVKENGLYLQVVYANSVRDRAKELMPSLFEDELEANRLNKELFDSRMSYWSDPKSPESKLIEEKAKRYDDLKEKIEKDTSVLKKKLAEDWARSSNDAKYSIQNVVMKDKSQATGAVQCEAQIKVEVDNWGSATDKIRFGVEKTTDGAIMATVYR